MMLSLRRVGLLLVASIVVLAAWRPWTEAQPRQTVRMLILQYLSYAPLFIAYEEGFFAEQGLDVELIATSRTSTAIPALIRGEIDVIPAAVMPSYFNVINRGAPIRVVAGKGYNSTEGCAYSGIMARRELLESGRLQSPADVAGRRISTDRTSPSYYRFDRFLASGGLSLDDATVIDVPAAARMDAFARGTLDVTTASEPWVTRYRRDGHSRMWSRASDHLPGFQFGLILFGKTLLQERPEDGKRFMLAYLKAVRHLNAEGKGHGHVGIVAKYTRLDEDLLTEACWPPIRNDGRVDGRSLEDYQRWAVDQGLVSNYTPIEAVYEPRYIEYANRTLDEPTGDAAE